MNEPKAIELALTDVLRECAEVGTVALRPWQALPEGGLKGDYERKFPCIDLRAGPPSTDPNGITRTGAATILCSTQTDEDQSHAVISGLYEAVQGAIDRLYTQGRTHNAAGAEWTAFTARMTAEMPTVTVAGFTLSPGTGPMDGDGLNLVGVVINVHFTNSGF
jgi:hypothetical protein